MATAYSGEVSIGTYNRIRIKCDYSGTSATCTVQFRRTQAYSGYWGDSRATLTFNGTTKGAGYSYSGTAGTSWINLVTVSGYSVSTSGGTYNWNFSNPGGVLGCSGTIVIGSQGSAPSDLAISLVEATWNSVTMETTVGNWGTGTNWQREAFLLEVPYVAGVDKYRAGSTGNTTQPVMLTVGTQSIFEFSNNPFVIYGCKEYYTGLWASTTVDATRLQGPTFYTAPYKLDSLTYASETFDGSTITATIAAKTNGTWNKSGATVGFLYQVSTDGGETFDGWKDLSTTATVGTTANLSIPNLQPGTAYVVEVAQICMDADIKYSSESSFVNFTTKKYRKTYGPGASGYVTSTFTDDSKHTVENTADHTLLDYALLGKTEQEKVTSSDSKNLVPLTPITGLTVFSTNNATYEYIWDKELKQTVLHMTSDGSYPQVCFSTTNYGITASKNYAVSIRYKATTNKTSFDGLGGVGFCGRNTWEIMGSNGSGVKPSPNRSEIQPADEWTVATLRISSSAPEWTSYTWNMTNRMSIMMAYNGANKTDFWISDISVEEITDAQYSADTFTPTFKPYTNKLAAPSPDYPLPVQTVTGRQTISITGDNGEEQEYEINLGKNIFKPYATSGSFEYNGVTTTMNSDGTVTLNGTATGDGWPELIYTFGSNTSTKSTPYLPANGMYTATIRQVSGTYSKGTSSYDAAWVVVCRSDNSGTGGIPVSGGSVVVAGVNGIYRSWINYRTGNTFNNARFALQFEKGPISTSWAPYFTPIELNKLNTYQDKIYPNNGKWYLHKETDKLTVVPNDLSGLSTHSGSFVTVNLVKSGIMQNSSPIVTTASENFVGATMTQTWNNQVSNSVSQATNGHYLQFCLPNSAGTTLDAVKTYFTNHPTDVRYVLTTATDTEITYAPLIEQLETLRRLGHTSVDATTFDRNGYGNATVGLEVKTANASSFPVGFTPLEYIESTGSQYINSGYTADHNTRIVVEYAFTNVSTKQQRIFGYQTGSGLWYSTYINSAGRAGTAYQDGSGQWWQIGSNDVYYAANTKYRMDYNGLEKMVTIYNADGSIFAERDMSNASATKACDGSMIILANQDANSAVNNYAYAKLYSFQMYDVNGIVRDFVPCKTIDNKVGLYDKVTKKFYPSATATAFTAGPVDSTLVTKQFRKLYGAKPAKKNLLDVPLNFTVTSSDRYKTVPITLESGKTYTCSVQDITTDSATYFLFLPYSSSGAVGDGFRLTTTNKTTTFTVPSDADRINIYSSTSWADSGSHTTTYHGIMIEEGDKATTYQAYSDGGKAGKAKKIKKLYGPSPAQVNLIHVGPLTQITHTQTSNSLVSTKKRLTCEEVNVSGTSTSNWSNFGPQYSVNWPAGTYTLTVDHPLPFDVILRTTGAGDKTLVKGNTSLTFTTTATATAYYFFNANYSSGTTFNETFKIQLVKGSTPDYDFKLYSDGTNANTTKLIYND